MRKRRRGPRSMHAIIQKKSKHPIPGDLQQPRGGSFGKSKEEPPLTNSSITILQVNIRGFVSHCAELEVHLFMCGMPYFVAITVTWLKSNTEHITLTGYTLISRRDRSDGRQGGGIALFALNAVASQVVHVADSITYERSWYIIHTDVGPISLGVWYRPPEYGELESITSLHAEWENHVINCIGTFIVGDMDVHHEQWLKYSHSVTPEGRLLFETCCVRGLAQCVSKPTRGKYLLDLVLTDMENITSRKVLPKIAGHFGSSVFKRVLRRQAQAQGVVHVPGWLKATSSFRTPR